jgi:hypothetical protein
MPAPKKNVTAAHTIISLTMLATGRLLLTTENRVYELVNNVWTPMIFADDEPEPAPEPTPAPAPALTAEPAPAPFTEPAPEVKP